MTADQVLSEIAALLTRYGQPVQPREGVKPFDLLGAEIEWDYREDEARYPREFWHARVAFLDYSSEWEPVGKQEQRTLPEHAKLKAEGRLQDELNKALATLVAAQPSAPEGWKLVPMEPTESQTETVQQFFSSYEDTAEVIYKAMLAAAPKFGGEE